MTTDPTRIDVEFDPLFLRMRGVATHGMTPFDTTIVSPITDDLWVGGCEDGLVLPDEVSHVVSLYKWEQYRYHSDVKSVLTVEMYDSLDGPVIDQVLGIAHWVNVCRESGITLVHCQAGLNRSNLVAATSLVLWGLEPDEAIGLLREKRSPAVLCNPTFESIVRSLADPDVGLR